MLVANTFADAFIAYQIRINTENTKKAVEDLSLRADKQSERIVTIKDKIATFVQQNGLNDVRLDATENTLIEELNQLNKERTQNAGDGESIRSAIDKKELELIELSKIRVEYNSLIRDLEVQENFYRALKQREQQERDYLVQGVQAEAVITERASMQ